MRKYAVLFGIIASFALLLSSSISPALALTVFDWNGHGVIAKWVVNVKQGVNTIQVPLTVVVAHEGAFINNWIYVQAGNSKVKQDLPNVYKFLGGAWYSLRVFVNIDLGNGLQSHLLDITWNWGPFVVANNGFIGVANGLWAQLTGSYAFGYATLMIDGGSGATPGNSLTQDVLGFDGSISLYLT